MLLTERPASIRVGRRFDDACVAVLDNITLGALGVVGREFRVEKPAQPHELLVRCGDVEHRQRWRQLAGVVAFSPEDP